MNNQPEYKRFRGTVEECHKHVAFLKKHIKGYRYRIYGRGPRWPHVGKPRARPSGTLYTPFTRKYTFTTLSHNLPLHLATHGVVYDNLTALSMK